jgi:GMP synthase-like glutamine amidotransferase
MSPFRVLHVQNEVTDPCVLFTEELEAKGMRVDTVHAYAGEPLPDSLDGYDGMVAGGGLVDTHQAGEHPWMQQEMRLIAEAVDRSVPYIGLCLGAQLLAEATGGEVYRCEPHEIGWTRVELSPEAKDDPLFGGLPEHFQAMQWHFYACRVPEDGEELMHNAVCTQALRVGDAAWGTQFHIEVNRTSLEAWLDAAEDELAENGYPREEFLRSLDELLPQHMEIGRTLARRLGDVIERRASRV